MPTVAAKRCFPPMMPPSPPPSPPFGSKFSFDDPPPRAALSSTRDALFRRMKDLDTETAAFAFPRKRLTAGSRRRFTLTLTFPTTARVLRMYLNVPREGVLYVEEISAKATPASETVTREAWQLSPRVMPEAPEDVDAASRWMDAFALAPVHLGAPHLWKDMTTFAAGGTLALVLRHALKRSGGPWTLTGSCVAATHCLPASWLAAKNPVPVLGICPSALCAERGVPKAIVDVLGKAECFRCGRILEPTVTTKDHRP